ncbi:hypothetical protein VIGAN_05137500 [Vigna angularis var. angularis]|uniref:Uncharacterized protein n=1 Tax=Vigna angularis var. angularis TaxID=157739 RepID=A0A0S3S592_PHAAN|nr:hypothetical protein VIGAN_05137500 [Vigna angularis var. angularis]
MFCLREGQRVCWGREQKTVSAGKDLERERYFFWRTLKGKKKLCFIRSCRRGLWASSLPAPTPLLAAVTQEFQESLFMAQPLYRWRKEKFPFQLHARFHPTNSHEMLNLLTQSYSEVGSFPHHYYIDGVPCPSFSVPEEYMDLHPRDAELSNLPSRTDNSICGMDFDKQGKYLVSCTETGCLTIHNFEVLYTQARRYPIVCR